MVGRRRRRGGGVDSEKEKGVEVGTRRRASRRWRKGFSKGGLEEVVAGKAATGRRRWW